MFEADDAKIMQMLDDVVAGRQPVETRDAHGCTALHYLAAMGESAKVHGLLQQKADINAQDDDGDTPLHYACVTGQLGIVHILMAAKANVNSVNKAKETAVDLAIQEDHESIVRALMAAEGFEMNMNVFGYIQRNEETPDFEKEEGVQTNTERLQKMTENGKLFIQAMMAKDTATALAFLNKQVPMLLDTYLEAVLIATKLKEQEVVRALIAQRDHNGRTFLHHAVMYGKLDVAEALLEAGADINAVDQTHSTALLYAMNEEDTLEMLTLLLRDKYKADVNIADKEGYTPLHSAGTIEETQLLVNAGADVTKKDMFGSSPLVHVYDADRLTLLLSCKGVEIDDQNYKDKSGFTLLHYAAYNNEPGAVAILIAHKANVNLKDREGKTALDIAVESKYEKVVAVLLSAPGIEFDLEKLLALNPKPEITEALKLAAAKRDRKVNSGSQADLARELTENKKTLMKAVADNDTKTVLGLFVQGVSLSLEAYIEALHLAVRLENKAVITAIIELKDSRRRTLLHLAVMVGNLEAAEVLLQAGADVNAVDEYNITPLWFAVDIFKADEASIIKMTDLLLRHKADVNIADNEGKSPLHNAQNITVVNLLLNAGANVNSVDIFGYTLLMDNNIEKLKVLLAHKGVDVNYQNDIGWSALHHAAYNGDGDVCNLLILHQTNVNLKDKAQRTPLYLAVEQKHEDVIGVLLGTPGIQFDLEPLLALNPKPEIASALKRAATKSDAEVVSTLTRSASPVLVAGLEGARAAIQQPSVTKDEGRLNRHTYDA